MVEAGEINGTFLHFMCLSMSHAWASGEAQVVDDVHGDDEDASSSYLRLYMAILLGVLLAACGELRSVAATRVPLHRVADEMASGLAFYSGHGAIEECSMESLQVAIQQLKDTGIE